MFSGHTHLYSRYASADPKRGADTLYVTPVSYTHLDVYKRQYYTAYQQPMQVDPTAPEDIPLSKRGNMHNIMGGYLAVSYTHLPMYLEAQKQLKKQKTTHTF